MVNDALASSGLEPSRLELEVTERLLLELKGKVAPELARPAGAPAASVPSAMHPIAVGGVVGHASIQDKGETSVPDQTRRGRTGTIDGVLHGPRGRL